MRRFHGWLISHERGMIITFCGFTAFCFCQTVLFSDIPELFRYGAKIGSFIASIGYSYIVSCIFYFVALKVDRNNKKTYNSYVVKKAKGLIAIFEYILSDMGKAANLPYTSKTEITTLLSTINPKAIASGHNYARYKNGVIVFEADTWAKYLIFNSKKMRDIYNQILPFLTVSDVRLTDLINDMFSSSFFADCNSFLEMIEATENSDLSVMENGFIDMIDNVRKLKETIEIIKVQYKIS